LLVLIGFNEDPGKYLVVRWFGVFFPRSELLIFQATRAGKKKNSTFECRHFPLAFAMEAVAKQATVIVFRKNEVAGSSDAPVCICDGAGASEIVSCKTCLTEYHIDCVGWKVVPGAKAVKYKCGLCQADADETGVRYWDGGWRRV
jgi:hypothetical protein